MNSFDPNAAASKDSGIFGLPFTEEQSQLIYLPVPWEATTSYGGGTSEGPAAIFEASHQVDLYDADVLRPYEAGLFFKSISNDVLAWNEEAKAQAQKIINVGGDHQNDPELIKALEKVNSLGSRVNDFVFKETQKILRSDKIPAIIGGDHSVPFGAFQAMAEKVGSFGILHLDAHSDTRNAYEGFQWSHASIMHNALERIPGITQLTQVGIRDFCEEEVNFCAKQKERVSIFLDRDLARRKMEGVSWGILSREIVATLPNSVWISFDIDGLDPRYCPHTGTPVPGGLDFHEVNFLFAALVQSGRRIVGFDLNEVSPNLKDPEDEWDANVGARLLYKLSAWTLASQSKAQIQI